MATFAPPPFDLFQKLGRERGWCKQHWGVHQCTALLTCTQQHASKCTNVHLCALKCTVKWTLVCIGAPWWMLVCIGEHRTTPSALHPILRGAFCGLWLHFHGHALACFMTKAHFFLSIDSFVGFVSSYCLFVCESMPPVSLLF